jgi:hypothetical protein
MGWIKLRPATPDAVLFNGNNKRKLRSPSTPTRKQNHESQTKRRAAFRAQGLTMTGAERINKLRPELKGLIGKDYQREYMRLARAEGKKY